MTETLGTSETATQPYVAWRVHFSNPFPTLSQEQRPTFHLGPSVFAQLSSRNPKMALSVQPMHIYLQGPLSSPF